MTNSATSSNNHGDDDSVVLKAKLPISVSKLSTLTKTAKALYGENLVILTSHPDSRNWLVIAVSETE